MRKRLGIALAGIIAIALSAFAHASPVTLEQTELLMPLKAQQNVEAAPVLNYSIHAYTAEFELTMFEKDTEPHNTQRSIGLVIAPTIAASHSTHLANEVGWRKVNYRF